MSFCGVCDLVPNDTRELVLGLDQSKQPARHVDLASGQGEGVGNPLVDDLEFVVEGAVRCMTKQPDAHAADVDIHVLESDRHL